MKLIIAVSAGVALGAIFTHADACNPMLAPSFGKHVASAGVPTALLASNNAVLSAPASIVGLWHDVRTASD